MRASLLALACLSYGATSIRVAEISDINEQVLVDTDRSDDASTAVVPHDYFTAEGAALRCKQARRGRNVRRIVGVFTGLLFAIPVGFIGGFATSASYWTWYLNGQTATMFVATAGAGALTAWTTIAAAAGGVRFGSWTTDIVARLFGADGHKPSCCCFNAESDTPSCALIGSSIGRKATCPKDAVHDPTACDTPEQLLEFPGNTVGECTCSDAKTCETNKFHRGHAWCWVSKDSPKGCRAQAKKWHRKITGHQWDYCKGMKTTLPNSTSVVNGALVKFTVNLDKGRFRADPRSVWRLGSWVDTSKALVVARVKVEKKMFKQSSCFAGEVEETLDGCAEKCINEGAPIGDAGSDMTLQCHAFAYNRQKRLCVRLPKEATGAEFKPFQKNPRLSPKSEGWSNYKRLDFTEPAEEEPAPAEPTPAPAPAVPEEPPAEDPPAEEPAAPVVNA